MKRFLTIIAAMVVLCGVSQARIIGTNTNGANADIWCSGGRVRAGTPVLYTEACLDFTGSFIPTSGANSNIQNLGTPTLAWDSLYLSSGVSIGTMTIGGLISPPNAAALCLSGGVLGHCTSVVSASGTCTCVAP